VITTVEQRYGAERVAEFYAAGHWRRDTIASLLRERASVDPDRVVVTDDTGSLTVDSLWSQSQRLARSLQGLGVGPGDRVSVQVPNWTEFPVIVAAVSALGAITVPIMPIYRREEVGYIVGDAEVKVSFTAPTAKGFDLAGMYADLGVEHVVVVRPDGSGGRAERALDELVSRPPEHDADWIDDQDPDLPWVIVYSSGTTSRPKGCVHTLNTISSSARRLAVALGSGPDDVTFGASPITHTQGLVNTVLIPLLVGGRARVMEGWVPSRAVEAIESSRATITMSPPTMLQMLLDDPAASAPRLASLTMWAVSGAAVSPDLLRRAKELMPGAAVVSAYGRTENITTTICTADDPPERVASSDGRALPGSSVVIVDDDGRELPRGEEGDIAFLGSSHMLEYLGMPEATADLFTPDGHSRSGDLGVMDDEGYVRVTGRTKDIVIRGGMNISVRQVEDLLVEHPAVVTAAVVAMPDARLGERLCCFAVLTPGSSLDLPAVRTYLLERGLALQKVPEHLELIEVMPTNALGKVQKNDLRAVARELACTSD
jgi:cyclohexanecarboxylate-CoA ligase